MVDSQLNAKLAWRREHRLSRDGNGIAIGASDIAPLDIHYREQSSGAVVPANRLLVQSSIAWVLAWAALP
jgi:hypothetical protein